MTSPRLIFDSTVNFLRLEIQSVFRALRKSTVKSNLFAIISPPGKKCGLAQLYRFAGLLAQRLIEQGEEL